MMSPKKNSGGNKSGGSKIHKSNIAKAPSENGGTVKKIAVVFIILAALVAGLLLFNKLGGCKMCDNISEYKESYDAISGGDSQDITAEDPYYEEISHDVTPSSVGYEKEEEPKVDNSSDASILDMFTGCGGKNGQESENESSERIVEVSPTDIGQFEQWEQPDSDAAYRRMMQEKLDEYITLFTRLEDLRSGLSECRTAEQVESNERYAALKAGLLNWCGGAQSFSALALNEDSREAAALAADVAEDTRMYLALYPTLVSTGDGEGQAKELADGIIDYLQQINEIITAQEQ